MRSEELKTLEEMQSEVGMVKTFLFEERSGLKNMIARGPSEAKPHFQEKLDTVDSLLKYIERVHSYFMRVVKENKE